MAQFTHYVTLDGEMAGVNIELELILTGTVTQSIPASGGCPPEPGECWVEKIELLAADRSLLDITKFFSDDDLSALSEAVDGPVCEDMDHQEQLAYEWAEEAKGDAMRERAAGIDA